MATVLADSDLFAGHGKVYRLVSIMVCEGAYDIVHLALTDRLPDQAVVLRRDKSVHGRLSSTDGYMGKLPAADERHPMLLPIYATFSH